MGILDDASRGLGEALDYLGYSGTTYVKGLTESGQKLYETLDKSIHNSYVESGWVEKERKTPNIRNVVTQTPELIIIVKKKMFSSLRDNFDLNKMDLDERKFLVASKNLFENKCKEIAAYEKISKVEKIIRTNGILNNSMTSFIIDAIEASESAVFGKNYNIIDSIGSSIYSNYKNVMNRIRDLLYQNGYSTTTRWVNGSMASGTSYIGKGSGIIELTLVNSFNCRNSIKWGSGGADFNIISPYRLFSIDENDIEKALLQCSDSSFNMISGYAESLQNDINNFITILNNARQARGASSISIQLNPYANLYNRIIIIMDKYGIELTSSDGSGLRPDLFNVSNSEAKQNFKNIIRKVSRNDLGYSVEKMGDIEINSFNLADIEIIDNTRIISDYQGTEKDLMQRIFENAVEVVRIRANESTKYIDYNEKTNYIRREMRLNYLGKQLIQPMDIVTAYISSQTIDDGGVLTGLKSMFYNDGTGAVMNAVGGLVDYFTNTSNTEEAKGAGIRASEIDFRNMPMLMGGGDILGQLNKNIGDLKELWGGVFGTNRTNLALEAEKNMLAGPDFPMYLYLSLRSYFGNTDYGACVFNGVVETVGENYSGGFYNVSVNCKDNSYYFSQIYYQDKPGADQFNGFLYDPLTPFDMEFDESTGSVNFDSSFKLLDENVALLRSGALRYKYGRLVNEVITQDNINSTDFEELEPNVNPYRFQSNTMFSDVTQNTISSYNVARRVFYNPDGFVYRWKKGIGTAWYNQPRRGGQVLLEDTIKNRAANVVRADPFTGQDVVNVISLLVCGEPYNFSTFMHAALKNGLVVQDINTNRPNDYFDWISKLIKRQNRTWGDFIPFKRFNISSTLYAYLTTAQLTLAAQTSNIQNLQNEKARLINQLVRLDTTFSKPENILALSTIKFKSGSVLPQQEILSFSVAQSAAIPVVEKILALDGQINIAEAKIQQSLAFDYANKGLRLVGTEDFVSGFYEGTNDVGDTREAAGSAMKELSRKQNYITQRRLWQVKSNTDKNLFIVCDEYDHDVDIQAIANNIQGYDFMNSTWKNIGPKIGELARIIGMEIFANTQGHIELRIPQYNRVPSSVFYNLIKKKRKYGIQLYPTFLEKTFTQRLTNVFIDLEVNEDWIRIYTSLLGAQNDSERVELLKGSIAQYESTGQFTGSRHFMFITDEDTGTAKSLQLAVSQIDQDYNNPYAGESFIDKVIPSFDTDVGDFFERNTDKDFVSGKFNYFSKDTEFQQVINQNGITAESFSRQIEKFKRIATESYNNFDIITQRLNFTTIYQNVDIYQSMGTPLLDTLKSNDMFADIITRLSRKIGQNLDKNQIVSENYRNSSPNFVSPSDILNIQKKLSDFVSKRYRAILSAMNLIKNIDQTARANANDSDVLSGLLLPNLFPGDEIPDYLSHMVEDETEDDYGYGAGKRYIIDNKDIVGVSYGERAPEFTSIAVKGAQAQGLVGGQGGNIGNGVEMQTVWAVDYDLWRMYGFKDASSIFLPFLSNVETQIAPFAIFLLNQQRAGLLHASVTRVGNEFIQPGEVYYLKDRDLLFYCEGVSHSFSYGGSFSTNMSLTFGHSPGEYIPTPLDVIGKSIYRGHYSNIGNYRMSHPSGYNVHPQDECPLGVVIMDTSRLEKVLSAGVSAGGISNKDLIIDLLFTGDIGERNKNSLTDIQYKLRTILNGTIANTGGNKYAAVSVRVYTEREGAVYTYIKQAADVVISYIMNPSSFIDGQEKGRGKNEEDATPLLKIPIQQIIGGDFYNQNNVGQSRVVVVKSKPKENPNVNDQIIRTPSAEAIKCAKEFSKGTSILDQYLPSDDEEIDSSEVMKALQSQIVDVWVEFIVPNDDLKKELEKFNDTANQTTNVNNTTIEDFYERLAATTNSEGAQITINIKAPK